MPQLLNFKDFRVSIAERLMTQAKLLSDPTVSVRYGYAAYQIKSTLTLSQVMTDFAAQREAANDRLIDLTDEFADLPKMEEAMAAYAFFHTLFLYLQRFE